MHSLPTPAPTATPPGARPQRLQNKSTGSTGSRARAHCNTSRCPPAAARAQVLSSHSQWRSRKAIRNALPARMSEARAVGFSRSSTSVSTMSGCLSSSRKKSRRRRRHRHRQSPWQARFGAAARRGRGGRGRREGAAALQGSGCVSRARVSCAREGRAHRKVAERNPRPLRYI